MKKRLKFFLWFAILLGFISIVSAGPINESLHINIQTTSAGAITTGTFTFGFNISTSPDCTSAGNVVFTNYSTLTTDSRGIISHYLDNINLNFSDQYWLCYYRNGVLIDTSRIARTPYTFRAKNISAQGIINDSNIDISGKNITSSTGFFNYLGDLLSRITTLFTQNINFNGTINGSGNINTTGNITTDWFNGKWNNSILYSHNTTANIGELYNATALLFAQMGNTTKNIQILINDTNARFSSINITGTSYLGHMILSADNISVNNLMSVNSSATFTGNITFGNYSDEFMRITDAGYVGIGTTNPSQPLEISNNAPYISFEETDVADNPSWIIGMLNGDLKFLVNGSSTKFFIDSGTGNIGIGTASPDSKLEVLEGNITVRETDDGADAIMMASTATQGYLDIYASGSKTIRLSGYDDSYFNGNGQVGIGTTNPQYGLLEVKPTAGDATTGITLFDGSGTSARSWIGSSQEWHLTRGATATAGITMDTSGNIGIGTITPDSKLNIVAGTENAVNITGGDVFIEGNEYNDYLQIRSGTADYILMSINSENMYYDGNLGIGTTSPTHKLEVNGTASFLGNILQTSGLNIINYIVHQGRKENFAGNNGMGQSAEVYNSAFNVTKYLDKYHVSYNSGTYQFSGGVFDGENIWMAPSYANEIAVVNPATAQIENISVDGHGTYAFYGVCFDGENVWFAPFHGDNFHKINIRTRTRTNYTNGYGDAAFSGCVFDGKKVWFIPEESDTLAYAWANDSKFVNITGVNISADYGSIAFNGGVFDGQRVWMIPYQSSKIVAVNITDGTLANYTHGSAVNTYVGGCFDGEKIWFAPSASTTIDSINPSTGEMTKYTHGESSDGFIGCTFDGTSIWFAPLYSDRIIKFNPKTGEMIKFAHNEGTEAFRGAIFDGNNVWLVPFSSDYLYRIRPPEFGKDSLYTSGQLNIGGNASFGENVGIGTDSPAALLHLYGSDARFRIQDDDSLLSYFEIDDIADTQVNIHKVAKSGDTYLDINPVPADGTSAGYARFFRETDTSGAKAVILYKGDNTATVHARIGVDGGDSYFQIGGGNVGIGEVSPDSALEVKGEVHITDTNTGSNAGTDLCIDANGRICACGSCA